MIHPWLKQASIIKSSWNLCAMSPLHACLCCVVLCVYLWYANQQIYDHTILTHIPPHNSNMSVNSNTSDIDDVQNIQHTLALRAVLLKLFDHKRVYSVQNAMHRVIWFIWRWYDMCGETLNKTFWYINYCAAWNVVWCKSRGVIIFWFTRSFSFLLLFFGTSVLCS